MKITNEELEGVKNLNNGDICFSEVMQFCLLYCDHDVVDNGAAGPARPPINLWK